MHSAQVIHRDLKPSNLLINENCDLKICDFGLAKAIIPELKYRVTAMTSQLGTRWYKAPEVLLSSAIYGTPVDM